MKNRYLLNELNFIEEAARELAGYDDASLLKEMEDAELEWELEKQRNPAKTREIMKSAEQGFSLLMARLQKEMVADGSLETEGKGGMQERYGRIGRRYRVSGGSGWR